MKLKRLLLFNLAYISDMTVATTGENIHTQNEKLTTKWLIFFPKNTFCKVI